MSRYCAGLVDSGLRQTIARGRRAREHRVERGHGHLICENERGVWSRIPAHREFPDVERVEHRSIRGVVVLGAYDRNRHVVLRTPCAIDIRWQQAVADQLQRHDARVEEELHGPCFRIAGDHLPLLERVDADAIPGNVTEVACRHDVRMRPDAVLRVVREERATRQFRIGLRDEGIAVVGSGRIARHRHRHAVVKDGAPGRELTQDPAILELVVHHDRVTRGIRAIIDRVALPEVAQRVGTRQ